MTRFSQSLRWTTFTHPHHLPSLLVSSLPPHPISYLSLPPAPHRRCTNRRGCPSEPACVSPGWMMGACCCRGRWLSVGRAWTEGGGAFPGSWRWHYLIKLLLISVAVIAFTSTPPFDWFWSDMNIRHRSSILIHLNHLCSVTNLTVMPLFVLSKELPKEAYKDPREREIVTRSFITQ